MRDFGTPQHQKNSYDCSKIKTQNHETSRNSLYFKVNRKSKNLNETAQKDNRFFRKLCES